MFNFPVKRRCGHEETVQITVELPPGKAFNKAFENLEKCEADKLCKKCHKEVQETTLSSSDWVFVVVFWTAILAALSGLYTYLWG